MRANVAEIEMDEKVVVLIDKETQSQGPLLLRLRLLLPVTGIEQGFPGTMLLGLLKNVLVILPAAPSSAYVCPEAL